MPIFCNPYIKNSWKHLSKTGRLGYRVLLLFVVIINEELNSFQSNVVYYVVCAIKVQYMLALISMWTKAVVYNFTNSVHQENFPFWYRPDNQAHVHAQPSTCTFVRPTWKLQNVEASCVNAQDGFGGIWMTSACIESGSPFQGWNTCGDSSPQCCYNNLSNLNKC